MGHAANNVNWPPRDWPAGVKRWPYELPVLAIKGLERGEAKLLSSVRRGRAMAAAAARLKDSGFNPDIIFTHSGDGGGALFLRDIFPNAKVLTYCEFVPQPQGNIYGFDPEFQVTEEEMFAAKMIAVPVILSLENSHCGLSPTEWQKQQFPLAYQPRISVIHDGVDTDAATPDVNTTFRIPGTEITLSRSDDVVTYVARSLEPFRGFHTLMRALPAIQARRSGARVVIVGEDHETYSQALPAGQTYKARLLDEVGDRIDLSKIYFTGQISRSELLSLLRVSTAHVYLTYPFVLSWSFIEAMSAGCLIIGSRTPPVEEVICHGQNGLLVDFFDPAQVADTVVRALEDRHGLQGLREKARQTAVERYDLQRVCLPARLALVHRLVNGIAA